MVEAMTPPRELRVGDRVLLATGRFLAWLALGVGIGRAVVALAWLLVRLFVQPGGPDFGQTMTEAVVCLTAAWWLFRETRA